MSLFRKAGWEYSKKCSLCPKSFGGWTGYGSDRHHCRVCLRSVCGNCSLMGLSDTRICHSCSQGYVQKSEQEHRHNIQREEKLNEYLIQTECEEFQSRQKLLDEEEQIRKLISRFQFLDPIPTKQKAAPFQNTVFGICSTMSALFLLQENGVARKNFYHEMNHIEFEKQLSRELALAHLSSRNIPQARFFEGQYLGYNNDLDEYICQKYLGSSFATLTFLVLDAHSILIGLLKIIQSEKISRTSILVDTHNHRMALQISYIQDESAGNFFKLMFYDPNAAFHYRAYIHNDELDIPKIIKHKFFNLPGISSTAAEVFFDYFGANPQPLAENSIMTFQCWTPHSTVDLNKDRRFRTLQHKAIDSTTKHWIDLKIFYLRCLHDRNFIAVNALLTKENSFIDSLLSTVSSHGSALSTFDILWTRGQLETMQHLLHMHRDLHIGRDLCSQFLNSFRYFIEYTHKIMDSIHVGKHIGNLRTIMWKKNEIIRKTETYSASTSVPKLIDAYQEYFEYISNVMQEVLISFHDRQKEIPMIVAYAADLFLKWYEISLILPEFKFQNS